jgi:hypothetical protein
MNNAYWSSPEVRDKVLTVHEIRIIQNQKSRKRRDTYNEVFKRAGRAIRRAFGYGYGKLEWDVPLYVIGLPPYNQQSCTKYVRRHLRAHGYSVKVKSPRYAPFHLTISWEPKDTDDIERKADEKRMREKTKRKKKKDKALRRDNPKVSTVLERVRRNLKNKV